MIYLLASVLFAAAAGASGAQQLWGHVAIYGVLCLIFMAAGCYSLSEED